MRICWPFVFLFNTFVGGAQAMAQSCARCANHMHQAGDKARGWPTLPAKRFTILLREPHVCFLRRASLHPGPWAFEPRPPEPGAPGPGPFGPGPRHRRLEAPGALSPRALGSTGAGGPGALASGPRAPGMQIPRSLAFGPLAQVSKALGLRPPARGTLRPPGLGATRPGPEPLAPQAWSPDPRCRIPAPAPGLTGPGPAGSGRAPWAPSPRGPGPRGCGPRAQSPRRPPVGGQTAGPAYSGPGCVKVLGPRACAVDRVNLLTPGGWIHDSDANAIRLRAKCLCATRCDECAGWLRRMSSGVGRRP